MSLKDMVAFTCMVSRAVYLKVLHFITSDSFISALRRFVGRRGGVGHIFSDNGTNFVGGQRVLKELVERWSQKPISDFLLQKEIDWYFNTPIASHFGGAWERLIRSVRKVFQNFTTVVNFSEEGLATFFFVEVIESILNSRPLTPFFFADALERPLTPNDLLMFSSDKKLPPNLTDISNNLFSSRWRHAQRCADMFWKRWAKMYLPTLTCKHKWTDTKRNVAVVLVDDNAPRSQWPLGRIVKVFSGSNNLVRSVLIETRAGELKRPISKLCVVVRSESRADYPT